jgi:hypothetical protein
MTERRSLDEQPFDERLRAHFASLREADACLAPDRAAMIARARAAAMRPQHNDATRGAMSLAHPASRDTRAQWRLVAWSAPLLVAAALVAVIVRSPSRADREFEAVVREWSTTSQQLATPTDQLLALPGSEYLHSLPTGATP